MKAKRPARQSWRAAAYVRMTSARNAQSPSSQADVIRRYAKRRGLEITRWCADWEPTVNDHE